MDQFIRHHISLILSVVLLLVSTEVFSADVGPEDLMGEDRVEFDRFRQLFQNGTRDEFFPFARDYEKHLRDKGYMMLYYKLLNNEGFFALRHNMIFRAMEIAKRLDSELRNDGASQFYYLASGLLGDVYSASHDRIKAEQYFTQALNEVGDNDPKFTIRTYHSMAEMFCLKDSRKSLEWLQQAQRIATEKSNTEYLSLSLAMTAYVYFMEGNRTDFYPAFEEYQQLRSQNIPGFNHRYDKILDVAKLAFDGHLQEARNVLGDKRTTYVDSSFVSICLYEMAHDIEGGFKAIRRLQLENDSIYSMMQSANFDQMVAESAISKSREEADQSKSLVDKLAMWMVVLIVVFLIVYFMGRRRLWLKIKSQNRELKAALAKAEESDLMKTAFIRTMSHEIRTPLNAVSGFSQVLCSSLFQLSDEEKRNLQQRISSNVGQIVTIVNEVLELSKSENAEHVAEADKSNINCNEFARSVVNEFKGKQNTGVEIQFTSCVDDDYQLRTNAYRLKSALSHLIDNAVKFTEAGRIEVLCEETDNEFRFIVTDTGVGIKEEDRERIFETFHKADDFKTGIGLGLPISRRLLHSLGGEVTLDTTYNSGARFVITLPISCGG